MAKAIKRRRGTTEEHKTFTGLDGEITVDTTKKTLVLHDQETAGGFPLVNEAMLDEAVDKVKEEAEQTFVHKSGNETIDGVKTVTSYLFRLSGLGIKKGEIPDEQINQQVQFADGEPFSSFANNILGGLTNTCTKTGAIETRVFALRNQNGSTSSTGATIFVRTTMDGTVSTSSPTPPILDNSTQIATTNWVRQAFPDWLSNNPSTEINADDQAAIHNGIYRGKNLTNAYTLEQLSAKLQAGDFTDLYIGDYITKPFTYNGTTKNVNWRFGHFNYWKYMGDTACTQNHILMVPDTSLFSSKMQATNSTEGGVPNSIVWKALQDAVFTGINATNCMNGHVLNHRDYIPVTVNNDAPSACGSAMYGTTTVADAAWLDVKLGMLKEPMVYGANIFSSSGRDAGCGKLQIALFRLDPTWINGRSARDGWWLGTVTASTVFAQIRSSGNAICSSASASAGVRPYFLFS